MLRSHFQGESPDLRKREVKPRLQSYCNVSERSAGVWLAEVDGASLICSLSKSMKLCVLTLARSG